MRWLRLLGTVVLVGACTDGTLAPTPAPAANAVAPAPAAVLLPTSELALDDGDTVALQPRVVDGRGISIPNATVAWESSDARVAVVAQTGVLRGVGLGAAVVTAVASNGVRASASVVVRARHATAGDGCGGRAAIALGTGEVRELRDEERDAFCVQAGTGEEYALVLAHQSIDAARWMTYAVTADGVATAPAARAPAIVPSLASAPVAATTGEMGLVDQTAAAEAVRRRETARALGPRVAGARRVVASRAARLTAAPLAAAGVPRVGEVLLLNTATTSACEAPVVRGARVEAVSARALVVADTTNPPGGLTSTDYAALAALFDTLVHPLGVDAFGAPTDIDANGGRVVLFFTRAVNELTPAGSASYVSGYFFARDLFPRAGAPALAACAGSNEAELVYMLAPDADGIINGNRRSRELVLRTAPGTLAHELQHLISASRRLYVNAGAAFPEAVWLDEGLSHIAEELAFYRASGLAPRGNLASAALVAHGGQLANYQSANLARLATYLARPASQSPFAADDSLGTRGAAWQLLRYVADRRGGDERVLWRALVDAPTTGAESLTRVAQLPAAALARDWAAAQYADDLGGADTSYAQPSWHYRELVTSPRGGYALVASRLVAGQGDVRTAVRGGSAAYVTFGGAGEVARLRIAAGTGAGGNGAAGAPPAVLLVRAR